MAFDGIAFQSGYALLPGNAIEKRRFNIIKQYVKEQIYIQPFLMSYGTKKGGEIGAMHHLFIFN